LVAVVAALGAIKFLQIRAAMAAGASFRMPPEAVTTIVAKQEEWPATLRVIGTVAAVHGVTVSADLPGIVEKISFDSGRRVREGEVLARLDTSQERAQLAAAQAQEELARLNLERMQSLREKKVVAQASYDEAAAEFKQAQARAGEIEATIERKQIRAPFSGVLGIRRINLGQYLTAGDPVVPLQSLDPVYVNFAVPQQDVAQLEIGAQVRVTPEDGDGIRGVGRITAVNSVVDEATRNVQVQATFANGDGALRPGMFVEVEVSVGASESVITLPAPAIAYAPYGNSVYVVAELPGPDGRM
jgi:membrane fusion protein (multidrug efflux system)